MLLSSSCSILWHSKVGKMCRQNVSAKCVGKMCRQNLSGKSVGKICRENSIQIRLLTNLTYFIHSFKHLPILFGTIWIAINVRWASINTQISTCEDSQVLNFSTSIGKFGNSCANLAPQVIIFFSHESSQIHILVPLVVVLYSFLTLIFLVLNVKMSLT